MKKLHAGKLCALFLSLLIFTPLLGANGAETEGGNISRIDVSLPFSSRWHGASGQALPAAYFPQVLLATGGNITSLDIATGSSNCTYGASALNILFSNSSEIIASLAPGNFSALDAFSGTQTESGAATFRENSSFSTNGFGNLTNVPTAYTEPSASRAFRLGYLQDQSGNLVFLAPAANATGYNGSEMGYQAILPTRNGSAVNYSISIDLLCNPSPITPHPGSGGAAIGGGTTIFGSSWGPIYIDLDIGYGTICRIRAWRYLTAYPHATVVTTVLENMQNNSPLCTLSNFSFTDFIPPSFGNISSLEFIPKYGWANNSHVAYFFMVFRIAEKKTVAYARANRLPTKTINAFQPMEISSDKLQFPPVAEPEEPEKPQPNQTLPCRQSIYCDEWEGCLEGYRSRLCMDTEGCLKTKYFTVEQCLEEKPPEGILELIGKISFGNEEEKREARARLCDRAPFLCTSQEQDPGICISANIALFTLGLMILLALFRRRKRETATGIRKKK